MYLRAYAEDLSGNRSSADDSPVFCITVDNTAPKTPYDLSASTENGSLELKWDTAETDSDIEYFKIYRREMMNRIILWLKIITDTGIILTAILSLAQGIIMPFLPLMMLEMKVCCLRK